MPSNIDVRISADVVDLQAKFAIARAESQSLSSELTKLARTAATTGMNDQLKSQLTAAAEKMVAAKAHTAELSSELKEKLTPSLTSVGESFENVSAFAERFGLALSVGGVIELGKAALESAAHIQHEAEVLNMGVVAYQAFTESAKSAGVETDTVDSAVRKFNASLGAAQKMTGSQADALRELGVSAFLPTEEALPAVAKSLLAVTEESRRTRLEVELFGRGGAELTPALKEWAKGATVVASEMRAMGLVLDPEMTERAHRLETGMSISFDQIKNKAIELVDWFDRAARSQDALLHGQGGAAASDIMLPPAHQEAAKPKGKSGASDTVKEANALADAVDSTRIRTKQLNDEIATLRKGISDPTATDAMKANFSSAIRVAESEIKNLNDKSSLKGTGFSSAGDKEIAQARARVSAINAVEQSGTEERRAQIQKVWTDLLSGDKLNAAQRLTVQEQMNRDIAAANKAAAKEHDAIAAGNLKRELSLQKIAYEERKDMLDAEVVAGRMSRKEELAALEDMLGEQNILQLQAVTLAEKGYALDTAKFHEYENQKRVIVAQSEAEIAKLRRQAVQDDIRNQFNMKEHVLGGERELIAGIFAGRQRLRQILLNIGLRMLQDYVTVKLQEFTQHILIEEAKTGATEAGDAARLASHETAEHAGSAISVAAGSMQILNDAYKAASGAFSAVASIPYVGPFLAPVAAAGAFAAVVAFDSLSSFDVGTNYVPHDMVAQIHQGERIIPAADNRALMNAVNGGGGGGGGGGPDVHVHVHAMDAASVLGNLGKVKRGFAKMVADVWRDNPSLRPSPT